MEKKQEYTVQEFAERVGASVATVRFWIATGKIEATKKAPKGFRERWYISENEVKKIIR